VEQRILELRRRLETYEQMLSQLRRDDDSALTALVQELERQAAQARAELAALESS
jgi:hypothetical protein